MAVQGPVRTVTTIPPSERRLLPGPEGAPFLREEYVSDDKIWIGYVTTEPGSASPWHHHGEHVTYAYLLEGEARIEFGVDTIETREAVADGSLHILPGNLTHREINPGTTQNKFLIIRVGTGQTVFPADEPGT